MIETIRRFFLTILIVVPTIISAQTLTNSPYSRYGIGDMKFQGLGNSKAIGNTSVGNRSPYYINKLNPASYSAFRKNTFLMEFGIESKVTYFETDNDTQISEYSNLSNIAAGFQIFDWWSTSFGLLPVSGVGYKATSYDSLYVEDSYSTINTTYTGEGGLNEIYWGNAFTAYKKFSLGVNTSYLFGSTDQTIFTHISESGFASGTTTKNRALLKGFKYQLGFQYNDTIKSKTDDDKNILSFTLGANFENTTTLYAHNTQQIIQLTSYINNWEDTLVNDTLTNGKVILPRAIGFGASAKFYDKLTLSADFNMQFWDDFSFIGEKQPLTNSFAVGVGMEYCNSPVSTIYRKTLRYRLGGYYANTHLKINDTQLADYGVTFGMGIPVKTTMINTSFQLGTRGTMQNNLIKESYVLLNINFSLYDTWFVKRKFF